MPTPPTEEQVLDYLDTLSNWGRWGDDDELGTLNLITPEKRRAAAALVREGISVSCSWEIETRPQPDHAFGTPQRYMLSTGQGLNDEHRVGATGARNAGALEFIGFIFHGYAITHIDGLCHFFWDGKMYNGKPAELVTSGLGATHHAITALKDGIVTRGVLLDVAAAQDRPWLDPGEGVYPEHLEAAEARQNVRVEPGDAVLLRTGYGRKKGELGREQLPANGYPGWHAASLPWLHERGAAVIGADTAQDAMPSGYSVMNQPVHIVSLTAMGLHLIDNANFEQLAETCERLGRWEFQFVLSPLRMSGGTGSPANPLAIF